MDGIILHKAYYKYLSESIFQEPEIMQRSNREATIIYLERSLYETKCEFMGVYGRAVRVISPRLSRMNRLVEIPELGGHIWMKEDGYDELKSELTSLLEKSERLYSIIQDSERDLISEKNQWESEKNASIHRKLRVKYYDEIMRSERWIGHKNPKQLELF